MQFDPEKLLARWVQSERISRGWSQQELSDRLRPNGMDVHSTGVTRLERGDRSIRFNDFYAICATYQVTVHELLSSLATSFEVGSAIEEQLGKMDTNSPAQNLEEAAETVHLIVSTASDMMAGALQKYRDSTVGGKGIPLAGAEGLADGQH